MIDLLEQYERMHDNNIMLSFKGEVTFDLVNSILKIIEERLNRTEEDLKTKKKVYNVLVECLQNLCHHIEESASEETFGTKTAILMVYMNDSTYHVLTGNYINNKNIDHLRNWLDQINAVSKDELRELYKKILNNEQFSDKGGGGLGFIDIARKSGQKLNYNFRPVNDNVSFFSFQINIPKQEV
jgi:hypothetical protein